MGRRVIDLLRTDSEFELVGAITHAAHPALGQDAGTVAGGAPLGIALECALEPRLPHTDVVIDFSEPEATLAYLPAIQNAEKALVIGTTGFTAAQREAIEQASAALPCFLAPNMSLGVNVLTQILQQVAAALGVGYDVEVIEAHHRTKVDAPSGTALHMATVIAEALGHNLEEVAVYGREGRIGRRSDVEIGIHSVRGGDIVGEHTVVFAGAGERLEFVHRSQSRDNFARGALRAASWLLRQPPGLYTMEHLLRQS
jgi:4-hydroxy-tetrahydrodipicolinate reductase